MQWLHDIGEGKGAKQDKVAKDLFNKSFYFKVPELSTKLST